VAAPSCVLTIERVARMLGEDEALLENMALMIMDPEDGRHTIMDLDDEASKTALAPFGGLASRT
jgi:hypothetical protein